MIVTLYYIYIYIYIYSDGSIGGPGMALATPQVLKKKKKKSVKKKITGHWPAPKKFTKKFISQSLPIELLKKHEVEVFASLFSKGLEAL
jgi:hypothetical protein